MRRGEPSALKSPTPSLNHGFVSVSPFIPDLPSGGFSKKRPAPVHMQPRIALGWATLLHSGVAPIRFRIDPQTSSVTSPPLPEWIRRAFLRSVPRWQDRSPAHRATAGNLAAAIAVTAVLALAALHQAWQVYTTLFHSVPSDTPVSNVETQRPEPPTGPEIDLQAIVDKHLFGERPDATTSTPPEPVAEAPDTTLNLRLAGTVADVRDNRSGVAIIAGEREQRMYAVSEEIDGTTDVTLYAVFDDRVILDRSGQLETLRLPEADTEDEFFRAPTPRQGAPVAHAPAPRTAPPVSRTAAPEGPARFANALRIDPHVTQGRMVGFRVNPGADTARFRSLGFLPGDVVVDINGGALNDPALGHRVFEGLVESPVANVTVIRDGASQTLTIDTDAL